VALLQGASNCGLALIKERLEARKRGEKVEVPWTLAALRREWNRAKETVAPCWLLNQLLNFSIQVEPGQGDGRSLLEGELRGEQ
jgi:putative transposase